MGNGFNPEKFNPAEKTLDIYFYDFSKNLTAGSIDKIFQESIKLSGAHIGHKKIISCSPGASGIYHLLESGGMWHWTPDKNPNFLSTQIRTCGNTHPILGLKNQLEKIDSVCGKICYYKEGMDTGNYVIPNTIDVLMLEYESQFDISKYRFEGEQVFPLNTYGKLRDDNSVQYNFYFYNPGRLKEKTAKYLGISWPLSEKEKKRGIYLLKYNLLQYLHKHKINQISPEIVEFKTEKKNE